MRRLQPKLSIMRKKLRNRLHCSRRFLLLSSYSLSSSPSLWLLFLFIHWIETSVWSAFGSWRPFHHQILLLSRRSSKNFKKKPFPINNYNQNKKYLKISSHSLPLSLSSSPSPRTHSTEQPPSPSRPFSSRISKILLKDCDNSTDSGMNFSLLFESVESIAWNMSWNAQCFSLKEGSSCLHKEKEKERERDRERERERDRERDRERRVCPWISDFYFLFSFLIYCSLSLFPLSQLDKARSLLQHFGPLKPLLLLLSWEMFDGRFEFREQVRWPPLPILKPHFPCNSLYSLIFLIF